MSLLLIIIILYVYSYILLLLVYHQKPQRKTCHKMDLRKKTKKNKNKKNYTVSGFID